MKGKCIFPILYQKNFSDLEACLQYVKELINSKYYSQNFFISWTTQVAKWYKSYNLFPFCLKYLCWHKIKPGSLSVQLISLTEAKSLPSAGSNIFSPLYSVWHIVSILICWMNQSITFFKIFFAEGIICQRKDYLFFFNCFSLQ